MTDSNANVPFSDDEIALAASNYEAQEWLVRALGDAFVMSELTIEQLADELGLSVEEAQDWLYGEVDLTLSELRQLANAIDAHVTYRVGAIKTKYVERFASMSNRHWKNGPEWSPVHNGPLLAHTSA